MGETAKALNIALRPTEISGPQELPSAFSDLADAQVGGLVVTDTTRIIIGVAAIAAFARKHNVPSVGPLEFAKRGGLVGYGVDFLSLFHRAAAFVDKILKGERPPDIPIERVTRFKLVLNLNTARELGLTVPPLLLATADEVIE
jgi:putative tryptophan/tyrosine transport system substrate-binding protein